MAIDEKERLRRWRLVLGGAAEGDEGAQAGAGEGIGISLSGNDLGMDSVLEALYDADKSNVGMGSSMPTVNRWLGDIRTYFPSSVVRVMQKDAFERLNLKRMLLELEMLEQVDPDIHLITTLLSLSKVIPEKTKDTARRVVRQVVEELERKLAYQTVQAIRGSLNRAVRNYRPRPNEIDWDRTIRANLKNYYLPERKTVIAERLVGYGHKHKRSSLRDIVLCVDQSGSMATSVVDLTEDLKDAVDLLFGTQLGGGTDTPRALAYCQRIITRPHETILVLISDLYQGSLSEQMLRRAAELVASGVQMICLLALDDRGTPSFDHKNAARMAQLGIPVFSCTPDLFPDMMAAAIQQQDLNQWAARNDIVTARTE